MVKLGVNIDHVATLREARKEKYPDILKAACEVEKAGADGITIHLREDRRHIQDKDVFLLRKKIKTKLNLEMSIAEDIVKVALKVKPRDVCIVPEKRQELTTEGGLDVIAKKRRLVSVIKRLKTRDIRVSLFIVPDTEQIKAAKEVGADYIELHTGEYALSKTSKEKKVMLKKIKEAKSLAVKLKLKVNAGHGLNYENVKPIADIKGIEELNIGHSIVSRAVFVGLKNAVREMKQLIKGY